MAELVAPGLRLEDATFQRTTNAPAYSSSPCSRLASSSSILVASSEASPRPISLSNLPPLSVRTMHESVSQSVGLACALHRRFSLASPLQSVPDPSPVNISPLDRDPGLPAYHSFPLRSQSSISQVRSIPRLTVHETIHHDVNGPSPVPKVGMLKSALFYST